jgi:hypothetical protein
MPSQGSAAGLLQNQFRCSEDLADFAVPQDALGEPGFFQFGPGITCYGRCSSGVTTKSAAEPLHDALPHVAASNGTVQLPFDPAEIVDNLRYERYCSHAAGSKRSFGLKDIIRSAYYLVRPLMPVEVRKHFQRIYLRGWDKTPFPTWPVDRTVENISEQLLILSMKSKNLSKVPFIWFWPEGAPSCAMVTHDVEEAAGRDFSAQLMDLNDSFQIKTSFQVVPEKRYSVPQSYLDQIRKRGFEVDVHDLNHDGHLFEEREEFLRRAARINRYARQFGALGFRSAILYRNADWLDALDFSYDMSIPNVAHLDPQRGGCCTVLPFFIGKTVELPVTATQDYSLFHILRDYSIRLWKEQIALIREKHGLISFIVHPDYIVGEPERRVYAELLAYLAELRSQGQTWIALPGEIAAWWRLRNELTLVQAGNSWRIQGKGCERARLAYAVLENGRLAYELAKGGF